MVERALARSGRSFLELRDKPSARSRIRRLRDLRIARRKEFLLLEFDTLPRRISEHSVEAANRHDIGKF
jgi:hypothetical protein